MPFKILFKRLPRQLKREVLRYGGLFLLIAASVYLIVATVCAADTVVDGITKNNDEHKAEDGQFYCMETLTEDEWDFLVSKGVTVEEHFSVDVAMPDNSVLRVFKDRKVIDTVSLDEGDHPKNDKEIILEKGYARCHDLTVGDTIKIGNKKYTVCGIGSTPDYSTCLASLSDLFSDGSTFGTGFVTAAAFDEISAYAPQSKAKEYLYAYRLTGTLTEQELNEWLGRLKFDVTAASNEYVRDAYENVLGAQNTINDASESLSSGLGQAGSGASALAGATGTTAEGLRTLNDAMNQVNWLISQIDIQSSATSEQIAALIDNVLVVINSCDLLITGAEEAITYTENCINSAIAVLDPSDPRDARAIEFLKSALEGCQTASGYLAEGHQKLANQRQVIQDLDTTARAYAEILATVSSSLTAMAAGTEQLLATMGTISAGSSALAEALATLQSGIDALQKGTDDLLDSMSSTESEKVAQFVPADENPRIGNALRDEKLFLNIALVMGALVLIILAYAIGIVISHTLEKELPVIGTLYALGIKRRDILLSYLIIPIVIALAGSVIGSLVGMSHFGTGLQLQSIDNAYSIPLMKANYSFLLFVVGVLASPIIAAIVNFLAINSKISRPTLELISNKPKTAKVMRANFLRRMKFLRMFQMRQILREKRSFLIICLGMFLSLSIALCGINLFLMLSNMVKSVDEDVNANYQYVLKYPPSEVPAKGTACYSETLKMPIGDTSHSITLMGIDGDNDYYDCAPRTGHKRVAVSSGVANKWNLKEGDEITLTSSAKEADYTFIVDQIFDYDVSFLMLMDIDSMRELFGRSNDFFNVVLSDKELNIEPERIYTIITKTDLQSGVLTYFNEHRYIITITLVMPIIIFAILIYLILSVMIDKNAPGISLLKVFGFPNKHIKKMYLNGNKIAVCISAIILVPITKLLVDWLYGKLVSNMATPFSTDMSFWGYLLVIAIVIVISLVAYALLQRKLKKIDCARAISTRE